MNEPIPVKEKEPNMVQPMLNDLKTAQRLLERDRVQWLATLNRLFRTGTVPEPALDGQYRGELIALDLSPGLTKLFQSITAAWMPGLAKCLTPPNSEVTICLRKT